MASPAQPGAATHHRLKLPFPAGKNRAKIRIKQCQVILAFLGLVTRIHLENEKNGQTTSRIAGQSVKHRQRQD